MRVIARTQTGQIVGCFERQSGELVAERFDEGLRLVGQLVFEGFRELMAWMHGLGAERFEVIA